MNVHIHIRIRLHVHVHVDVCKNIHVHTYVYVYMHVCMSKSIHRCTCGMRRRGRNPEAQHHPVSHYEDVLVLEFALGLIIIASASRPGPLQI